MVVRSSEIKFRLVLAVKYDEASRAWTESVIETVFTVTRPITAERASRVGTSAKADRALSASAIQTRTARIVADRSLVRSVFAGIAIARELNVTAAVVAFYSDATVVIHLVGFDLKGQSNLHSYTALRVMYS